MRSYEPLWWVIYEDHMTGEVKPESFAGELTAFRFAGEMKSTGCRIISVAQEDLEWEDRVAS